MDLSKIKGLLIDIDDTIIRLKNPELEDENSAGNTSSLFKVLQLAGVELGGLSPSVAAQGIELKKNSIKWWSWDDFIDALGLDHDEFWEYAYQYESDYLEPCGPEIPFVLNKLRNEGFKLYISSNNPRSGILHKLRLGGISNEQANYLFDDILGATELQSMKWETDYWQKAIRKTGLPANALAVMGDDDNDDYKIPHSVGIACTFLIKRSPGNLNYKQPSLIHVRNFNEIADCLIPAPELWKTIACRQVKRYDPA